MKPFLILSASIFLSFVIPPNTFRQKQMSFTRIRQAYAAKEKVVAKSLAAHSILRDSLRIYLRAFKAEKTIELWARNQNDSMYCHIKEFPICEISGEIGPKRCVKDLQVPEGFYHISDLNPYSKYHLSMQINYPNASNSIRGMKGRLGNLIFIHGGCESSGCLAINDEQIQELFVYCIEAYNSGQANIDITIFPCRLNDANYSKIISSYKRDKDKTSLWADLKKHYDRFNQTGIPPSVRFLSDGTHVFIDQYTPMTPKKQTVL
ncbi:MAG: hypothetical protein QM786_11520 [Breznakibacter sp.]